jgi:serine/threonine-protein kinase
VARIEHPNVIEIVDFGRTPSGSPFLVMELLKGESLDHLLKRDGPMRWERAKAIGLQLIAALSAAHSAGVLHRDVKPGNVWIRPTASGERCKLLDFGISQVHALGNEEKAVTQAGTLIGTPAYMSPEQIHGNTADPRSDIYSVGAVLHAMLAGEGPYDGSTTAETLYRQLFEEPIPLRSTAQGPEIPPSFEAVVLRCLRKHPELRFPTMLDLKAALEGVDKGARLTVVPSEVLPQPAPELRQRYQTQWAVQPGVPAVEPAPVATESNTGRVVTLAVGLTFAVACCASVAALVVAPELLGDTPGDVTENAPAAEEPMKAGAAPKVAAPPWVPVVPIPAPPETAPAEDVTEPPADDVEAEAEPPAPVRTPKPRKHRAKKRKQEKPSEPPPPEPAPLPRKNEAKKKSRVEDDIREVTFD